MSALRRLSKRRRLPGYCYVDAVFIRGGKRPGTTWACSHEECRIRHASAPRSALEALARGDVPKPTRPDPGIREKRPTRKELRAAIPEKKDTE